MKNGIQKNWMWARPEKVVTQKSGFVLLDLSLPANINALRKNECVLASVNRVSRGRDVPLSFRYSNFVPLMYHSLIVLHLGSRPRLNQLTTSYLCLSRFFFSEAFIHQIQLGFPIIQGGDAHQLPPYLTTS